MESNKEELIQKIINIMIEEDCEKLGSFIEKIDESIKENIVNVLVHLDEVDEKTETISFSTKINVYSSLFSRSIYEKVIESVKNKKDNYFGLFLYGGIICESLKMNLHENVISSLQSESTYNDSNERDIAKYAIILACTEKKKESLQLIHELYNDVKINFQNNEILQLVIEFVRDNNIQIIE